jgi:trehalose 6-phosphate phosphatase
MPAASTDWALFLDVDGTLLEFADSPDAVHVPAGLISLLLRLQHRLHGALALISGRRIASLDNLFKPLVLPAAGLHGFECRDARGVMRQSPLDENVVIPLHRHCREIAAAFPDVLIEDKEFSVAFHYGAMRLQADSHKTALDDETAAQHEVQHTRQPQALRASLSAVARSLGFELLEGRSVFELKPATVNKGSALVDFMGEPPFAGRLPVFLGDDFTDEYALRATRDLGGMAIQVDDRIEGSAQFGLPGPQAVMQWLHNWEEQFL